MLKPPLRLFALVALTVVALPIGLLAQAAVEYAMQAGSTAVSHITGSVIAGCNVNSSMLVCLSHYYPRTAMLVVGVICLVFVRWLAGVTSYRAR